MVPPLAIKAPKLDFEQTIGQRVANIHSMAHAIDVWEGRCPSVNGQYAVGLDMMRADLGSEVNALYVALTRFDIPKCAATLTSKSLEPVYQLLKTDNKNLTWTEALVGYYNHLRQSFDIQPLRENSQREKEMFNELKKTSCPACSGITIPDPIAYLAMYH